MLLNWPWPPNLTFSKGKLACKLATGEAGYLSAPLMSDSLFVMSARTEESCSGIPHGPWHSPPAKTRSEERTPKKTRQTLHLTWARQTLHLTWATLLADCLKQFGGADGHTSRYKFPSNNVAVWYSSCLVKGGWSGARLSTTLDLTVLFHEIKQSNSSDFLWPRNSVPDYGVPTANGLPTLLVCSSPPHQLSLLRKRTHISHSPLSLIKPTALFGKLQAMHFPLLLLCLKLDTKRIFKWFSERNMRHTDTIYT